MCLTIILCESKVFQYMRLPMNIYNNTKIWSKNKTVSLRDFLHENLDLLYL